MVQPLSRFDWHDPPFAGGQAGARMGLAPLPSKRWLTQGMTSQERALKLQVLKAHREQVYVTDQTLASEDRAIWAERLLWQTAQQVCALEPLQLELPCAVSSVRLLVESSPLVRLCLQVVEDLCLLLRCEDEYRLFSACVCQPSYWSLPEKIGKSLAQIHQPVADLDAQMSQAMNRFFARIPPGRVFGRRNWSIHDNSSGYQPDAEPSSSPEGGASWFLRSERQSIRRLSPDLVVFAIRVDIEPLARVSQHELALADLRTAVEGLTPYALRDFGGASKQQAVLDYLSTLCQSG